ncbi:MAG: hypothetical protein J4473_00715 [Candidatus Aenigmarchaeota archaeon]|nr:hypothetical protein [Candidatus Aenigmarchaeota archaeon]
MKVFFAQISSEAKKTGTRLRCGRYEGFFQVLHPKMEAEKIIHKSKGISLLKTMSTQEKLLKYNFTVD